MLPVQIAQWNASPGGNAAKAQCMRESTGVCPTVLKPEAGKIVRKGINWGLFTIQDPFSLLMSPAFRARWVTGSSHTESHVRIVLGKSHEFTGRESQFLVTVSFKSSKCLWTCYACAFSFSQMLQLGICRMCHLLTMSLLCRVFSIYFFQTITAVDSISYWFGWAFSDTLLQSTFWEEWKCFGQNLPTESCSILICGVSPQGSHTIGWCGF